MKKYKRIFCFLLMLTAVFIFFVPLNTAFAANSYDISAYNINVSVNKDGSADIEEQITYNFSGKFNGALRDVDFSKTSGITNQSVYVVKNGSQKQYIQNDTSNIDYSGLQGTYNFVKSGQIAHFKIFEPSQSEKKTFVIKYTLLNVATKYNDIAEFNRKLIDKNWQCSIYNIDIKVNIPDGATKDDIRVFAHGPLTGVSKILDNRNVEFTVPSVSAGTTVETLVLFPINLVPNSTNIVKKDALASILANEKALADQANQQRDQARQQEAQNQNRINSLRSVGNAVSWTLIAVWILIFIFIYIKYDREFKPAFEGKYYRELPGEYTPAEVGYLMSFGQIGTNDIMATLLDLVRKRQLLISARKLSKNGIFGDREVTEYTISINKNSPKVELKEHEEYLADWFVKKIGDGESVTLDQIKDYVKSRTNALEFRADYDFWSNLAKVQSTKNNFIDKTCKTGKTLGVLLGIVYLIAGFFIITLLYTPMAAVLMLLGVILILYSVRIQRRTNYGSTQYEMWKAFRNFLLDFSKLNKAEIGSVAIWEHFLVYAVSLGVAKQVIKQLPLVFKENELNDTSLVFFHGMGFGYLYGFSSMFDSTIHAVDSAVMSAANIANSQNSSFSGGGGGFSGGSSFGGGGGGGGGAF